MSGKHITQASTSGSLLESSNTFSKDAIDALNASVELYLGSFNSGDPQILQSHRSINRKSFIRKKSDLVMDVIKSHSQFEEDKGNLNQLNTKLSRKSSSNSKQSLKSIENLKSTKTLELKSNNERYLAEPIDIKIKSVKSATQGEILKVPQADNVEGKKSSKEGVSETKEEKEDDGVEVIDLEKIEKQMNKNENFIESNFGKPKETNTKTEEPTVLGDENNKKVADIGEIPTKTDTPIKNPRPIDIFDHSGIVNSKNPNFAEFNDFQASPFPDKTGNQGGGGFFDGSNTPKQEEFGNFHEAFGNKRETKPSTPDTPGVEGAIDPNKKTTSQDHTAIWILDKLDSKRNSNNKSSTVIDENAISRRAFKKQNRSTIVESSNSFSKSRNHRRNSISELKNSLKTSVKGGEKNQQKHHNKHNIKIINEEEEDNQEVQENPDKVINTNISPITPDIVTLNPEFNFGGDMSGVHGISHISNSSQNLGNVDINNPRLQNVITHKNLEAEGTEEGQDNIQTDREGALNNPTIVRMESSKVLQEIDSKTGSKIEYSEAEKEHDLLGMPEKNEDLSSKNKYNLNVDPQVLEKSLNMTNEIIQMAQSIDQSQNLTGYNDDLIDLSNAMPINTQEELKNTSQTPVLTEGFMDNSALFKEEDTSNEKGDSKEQQNQSVVSAVQNSKKDPFSVFDELSPQRENPDEQQQQLEQFSVEEFSKPKIKVSEAEEQTEPTSNPSKLKNGQEDSTNNAFNQFEGFGVQIEDTNPSLNNNFMDFNSSQNNNTQSNQNNQDFMNFATVPTPETSNQDHNYMNFNSGQNNSATNKKEPFEGLGGFQKSETIEPEKGKPETINIQVPNHEFTPKSTTSVGDIVGAIAEDGKSQSTSQNKLSVNKKSKEQSVLDEFMEKSLNASMLEKKEFDKEVDELVPNKDDPVNNFKDLFF